MTVQLEVNELQRKEEDFFAVCVCVCGFLGTGFDTHTHTEKNERVPSKREDAAVWS